MAHEIADPRIPRPSRCDLCGDDDPLTWIDVGKTQETSRWIAVCAACFVDLGAEHGTDESTD
jgi:hypothetical protein